MAKWEATWGCYLIDKPERKLVGGQKMNGFFRLINVEDGFALQLIPPDADGEEINI